jgi:hypothetical protein
LIGGAHPTVTEIPLLFLLAFIKFNSGNLRKREEIIMIEWAEAGKRFVRVKDAAGNEFICPLDALKDPKHATEEELANCVDDATVFRFPREVEIKQP